MDYLDLLNEKSYEEKVCQAEFYAECYRDKELLKGLEKENERNRKS